MGNGRKNRTLRHKTRCFYAGRPFNVRVLFKNLIKERICLAMFAGYDYDSAFISNTKRVSPKGKTQSVSLQTQTEGKEGRVNTGTHLKHNRTNTVSSASHSHTQNTSNK